MADGKNSGLASGTNGSRQLTVENGELEQLVSANENKVDFYGGGSGKLLPAEYKQWIGVSQRDNLLSKAKNVVLRNAVNQLYRPGAFIGDGGTASVIKFEKRTGLYLGIIDKLLVHSIRRNNVITIVMLLILHNLFVDSSLSINYFLKTHLIFSKALTFSEI